MRSCLITDNNPRHSSLVTRDLRCQSASDMSPVRWVLASMKILLLLATFFISQKLFASVTECEMAFFKGSEANYVTGLYQDAEIVIELGPEIEKIDENVRKYVVLGVWKGDVGEYVYLSADEAAPVFFGKQIEPNLLESTYRYQFWRCPFIKDSLISEFGTARQPSSTFFYRNHASSLLVWVALFCLLATTGLNVLLYRWLKPNK